MLDAAARAVTKSAFLACVALAGCAGPPAPPDRAPATTSGWLDDQPRIAVISAFPAELALLLSRVEAPRRYAVNGVEFTTGRIEGKPVVLLLSGISMVNAAMNTQLALDRFHVSHIVFSGIAGGVNPELHIGDVSVPLRWGQYLEGRMLRETAPGRFEPRPAPPGLQFPAFGMLQPQAVAVRSATDPGPQLRFWFEVDPALRAVAERLADVPLESCSTSAQGDRACLSHRPRLVVGGAGVSGASFVDNAAFRQYTFDTFQANVLDMESAATATVAYGNGVPFIAFRSLSDLAGGGEGANEMRTFLDIAAANSARVLLAFLAAWK